MYTEVQGGHQERLVKLRSASPSTNGDSREMGSPRAGKRRFSGLAHGCYRPGAVAVALSQVLGDLGLNTNVLDQTNEERCSGALQCAHVAGGSSLLTLYSTL